MRHQCFGLDQSLVIRDQLQVALEESTRNQSMEMSFEYKPSAVENLFAPADAQTKKIQSLAIQKTQKVELEDIKELLGYIDSEKQLVFVKVNSEKFQSTKKVAAFIGRSLKKYLKEQKDNEKIQDVQKKLLIVECS